MLAAFISFSKKHPKAQTFMRNLRDLPPFHFKPAFLELGIILSSCPVHQLMQKQPLTHVLRPFVAMMTKESQWDFPNRGK